MKQILVVGCLLIGLAVAFDGAERPGLPKKIIEQLELNQEQTKKLQDQKQAQKIVMQEKFLEIKKLHNELDQEFLKPEPNEVRIKILVGEIKNIQAEIADKHFEGLFALREVLTQEQFKKMVTLRQEMRGKLDKKVQRRMPRGEWF
jgi:Spy/CpxP family protein refolding chaperone